MLAGTADIERMIEGAPSMRAMLGAVASLALPDCMIAAGFVRNAVWDTLHGRVVSAAPPALRDVDVVYFDPLRCEPERDRVHEARLRAVCPGVNWEVKNQARMHLRNGDAAYRDSAHAISHFPEVATSVGARLTAGRVELVAPLGVGDLLAMVVRPTPAFRSKLHVYRERQRTKNWRARWPWLRFEDDVPRR